MSTIDIKQISYDYGKFRVKGLSQQGGGSSSGVSDAEKATWNGKQDVLVSGTNIKTINNESILGNGNITIPVVASTTTCEDIINELA